MHRKSFVWKLVVYLLAQNWQQNILFAQRFVIKLTRCKALETRDAEAEKEYSACTDSNRRLQVDEIIATGWNGERFTANFLVIIYGLKLDFLSSFLLARN